MSGPEINDHDDYKHALERFRAMTPRDPRHSAYLAALLDWERWRALQLS